MSQYLGSQRSKNPEEITKDYKRKKYFCQIINIFTSIFATIFSLCAFMATFSEENDKQRYIYMGIILFFIIILLYFIKLYLARTSSELEKNYCEAKFKSELSSSMFESLCNANTSKTKNILRHTYGCVSQWNPINYSDNYLLYDIHEHIRSILVSMRGMITHLYDDNRFTEDNVNVDLVYTYGEHGDRKCSPKENPFSLDALYDNNKTEDSIPDWKVISSGNRSGSSSNVLDHLKNEKSFYHLLDKSSYYFKNIADEKISCDILSRLKLSDVDPDHIFYVKDEQDYKSVGSIVGVVIQIVNDDPNQTLVKAILTLRTREYHLYDSSDKKFENISKENFEEMLEHTVFATYKNLLSAELTQMYVRHSLRKGDVCPFDGSPIPDKPKDPSCEKKERFRCQKDTCRMNNQQEKK